MQHEVTNDWNPICKMRLPTVELYMRLPTMEPYMYDEVSNSRHEVINVGDPMCYTRLPMIGTLLWDSIWNMKLPVVGSLYGT